MKTAEYTTNAITPAVDTQREETFVNEVVSAPVHAARAEAASKPRPRILVRREARWARRAAR